jgi:hypothetical protein
VDDMGWLLAAGAAGVGLNAYGKYRAGESAKDRKKFEAKQMEQTANKVLSASQRESQEIDRQGRLQQSRALAIAASSGGGASDPTVMNLFAELAGETDYRKTVALYEGKEDAASLRLQAEVAREEGDLAKNAGQISAVSTLLSGGASLYSKYGVRDSMRSPAQNNTWAIQRPMNRRLGR